MSENQENKNKKKWAKGPKRRNSKKANNDANNSGIVATVSFQSPNVTGLQLNGGVNYVDHMSPVRVLQRSWLETSDTEKPVACGSQKELPETSGDPASRRNKQASKPYFRGNNATNGIAGTSSRGGRSVLNSEDSTRDTDSVISDTRRGKKIGRGPSKVDTQPKYVCQGAVRVVGPSDDVFDEAPVTSSAPAFEKWRPHLKSAPPKGRHGSSNSEDSNSFTTCQNSYEYQRKWYYNKNSKSHLPDLKELEKCVQAKDDFELKRSVPIFYKERYEFFLTPEQRTKGLYIRVRFQAKIVVDNTLTANAFIPIDSSDEEIRTALVECQEILEKLTGGHDQIMPISKVSLPFLKTHSIELLDKKSENHPEASYYCSMCDYHLNSIGHIKNHFDSSSHFNDEVRAQQRAQILSKMQLINKKHFNKLSQKLVEQVDEIKSHKNRDRIAKEKVSLLRFLKNDVFPKVQPCGDKVILEEFGSTVTNVFDAADVIINISFDIPDYPVSKLFELCALIIKTLKELGIKINKTLSTTTFTFTYQSLSVRMEWRAKNQTLTTKLINTYVQLRPEVPDLMMLIRQWARRTQNDSSRMGMAKYGFDLMVIHYLQSTGRLPVLHEMMIETEPGVVIGSDPDVPESVHSRNIRVMQYYLKDVEIAKQRFPAVSEPWNWAEVWLGFYKYYTEKHINLVIQITQTEEKTKESTKWNKKGLHLVDPFRNDNVIPTSKTFLNYFFNCLLTTYLNFSMPTTKQGPLGEVILTTKNEESRNSARQTKGKHVAPAKSADPKHPKVSDEELQQLKEEKLREMMETIVYLGKKLSELTMEDLRRDVLVDFIYSAATVKLVHEMKNDYSIICDTLPDDVVDEVGHVLDDSFERTVEPQPAACDWNQVYNNSQLTDSTHQRTESSSESFVNLELDDSKDHGEETENAVTLTNDTLQPDERTGNPSTSTEDTFVEPRRKAFTSLVSAELGADFGQPPGHVAAAENAEKLCLCEFFIEDKIDIDVLNKLVDECSEDDFVFSFSVEKLTNGYFRKLECSSCNGPHVVDDCPQLKIPDLAPSEKKTEEEIKELDDLIESLYERRKVTEGTIGKMERAVKHLEKFLQKNFMDTARLSIFGSIMSGMSFHQSDVDICFRTETDEAPPNVDPATIIRGIAKKLYKYSSARNVVAITTAKVPIVKLRLHAEGDSYFDVDISYYNTLALYNTDLLRNYCNWAPDNKMAKLALFVKHWASTCLIKDASKGSISSYAHVLFLIHYLQRVDPPCVPYLQHDFRDESTEARMVGKWDTYFHVEDPARMGKWSTNEMSVGELFLGFLDYFAHFDFRNLVVQISRPDRLSKMEKDWNKPLCIEDPFDRSHNLSSGVSKKMFIFIQKTFINSRNVFHTSAIRKEFLDNNRTEIFRKYKYQHKLLIHMLNACKQGDPPSDRLCRICHCIGHFAESCPRNNRFKPMRRRF